MKAGYERRDAISHRMYNRDTSINRYERTGKVVYKGTKVGGKIIYGLGHKAGENWADAKQIDPQSPNTKYSKNSPSFDEGVYISKKKRMANKISPL